MRNWEIKWIPLEILWVMWFSFISIFNIQLFSYSIILLFNKRNKCYIRNIVTLLALMTFKKLKCVENKKEVTNLSFYKKDVNPQKDLQKTFQINNLEKFISWLQNIFSTASPLPYFFHALNRPIYLNGAGQRGMENFRVRICWNNGRRVARIYFGHTKVWVKVMEMLG